MSEGYTLWVERVAGRFGFDRVCARLPRLDPSCAPYLYVLSVLFIDVPVLSTIAYLFQPNVTFHPILDYPWWGLVPVGLVLGVYGIRRTRSRFTDAVQVGRGSSEVRVSTPRRFRVGVYVAALGFYLLSTGPALPELFSTEGTVIGVIKWLGIIPFVYIPLIVEFVVVYLHGLFFLPVALSRDDVDIDFADPTKLGGMGPVGALILTATKLYYLGLTLWTLFKFLGIFIGIKEPVVSPQNLLSITFFTAAWIAGAVLFLGALFVIHRHMLEKRAEKIEEITNRIRNAGTDDEVFPYVEPADHEERVEYLQEYANLRRVEETRTYPFDVNKLWELFAAAVFPVLIQAAAVVLS